MEIELNKIEISLTQYEAASIIEAIHDSLFRKVRWTINPNYDEWHKLDFTVVKASIDSLATAYLQIYMAFRQSIEEEHEEIDAAYEKAFIITDEAWKVIDQIRNSNDWSQVDRHLHSETLCRACRELNRISKA